VTAADVSQRNAEFWDELCGTHMARQLGIRDASPGELARFDAAYLDIYPYLLGYFPREWVEGRQVLEVGLGYGTLSEKLARMGADYHGLDIAAGPVAMVQHRLGSVPGGRPEQVHQGSVLELPWPDASFDVVASIGCLHHTGDLFGAIQEVRRVLRPGGRLVLMVYNRRSLRRLVSVPLAAARQRGHHDDIDEEMRARYDATTDGAAAPHTDFVTAPELRGLLHGLRDIRVERRNMDALPIPFMGARSRSALMALRVDRLLGLDLYVTAQR
jgi:SAM-dependent methyltransferase